MLNEGLLYHGKRPPDYVYPPECFQYAFDEPGSNGLRAEGNHDNHPCLIIGHVCFAVLLHPNALDRQILLIGVLPQDLFTVLPDSA